MPPLQWPSFLHANSQFSWFERFFKPDKNYFQVTDYLKGQLLARPRPDPKVWGEDPMRIRIGLLVCKRVQEEYAWPNDHFLPEDPFDIAFLIPWDDLEVVEVVMQLEQDLGIVVDDAETLFWSGTTLRHVVDTLYARCRAQSR